VACVDGGALRRPGENGWGCRGVTTMLCCLSRTTKLQAASVCLCLLGLIVCQHRKRTPRGWPALFMCSSTSRHNGMPFVVMTVCITLVVLAFPCIHLESHLLSGSRSPTGARNRRSAPAPGLERCKLSTRIAQHETDNPALNSYECQLRHGLMRVLRSSNGTLPSFRQGLEEKTREQAPLLQ
jgi:hypothetical protein